MITRLGVAILALYLVHGARNGAEDTGRLAAAIRDEAPRAALALCLDHAALCGRAAGVAGPALGARAPRHSPAAIAVNAPIPPVRPARIVP